MTKLGSKVRINYRDEEIEGILINDENEFTLKLPSGYNLILNKKEIKKINIIEEPKKINTKKKQIKINSKLPKITILHTGGTIASEVDYRTGAVYPQFTPEEILTKYPELTETANIHAKLVTNVFSEDMGFKHLNKLAKEIEKEIKEGASGIIVTHGTDTLHYTSAALSFILEGLNVPVVCAGSQRSSDRGSSDAFLNLISAVKYAIKSEAGQVTICMHENMDDKNCVILPGLKSRKMHTSRRDAFKPVNDTPIARVNYEKDKIEIFNETNNSSKLKLKLFDENVKVGLLKVHPNMHPEEIKNYSGFDGLVIEGTGIGGHLPINFDDKTTEGNKKIYDELVKLCKKIPVVATSQCIFGRINMNVYTTGRKMQEIGIIGNQLDMTPETAFIKLAWLISNKMDVKNDFQLSLRGEITDRTQENEYGL